MRLRKISYTKAVYRGLCQCSNSGPCLKIKPSIWYNEQMKSKTVTMMTGQQ